MELFENVREILGCEYISDLNAANLLKTTRNMDLTPYNAYELADMAEYLYGKKMHNADKDTLITFLKKGLFKTVYL